MAKKNIVIVGGGSAGGNAARALSRSLYSSKYQLILINPLPYRIWLIATLRMTVSDHHDSFQQDTLVPYDKIFINGNGKFVEGTVSSFTPAKEGTGGTVTLNSGEIFEYVTVHMPVIVAQ